MPSDPTFGRLRLRNRAHRPPSRPGRDGPRQQRRLATYLEHARLEYPEEVAGIEISGTGLTIVDVNLEFRRAIEWGDSVTVGVRVPEVGTSSIPIEYRLETDDGVAAEGETTLVHVDRETGEAAPIPDDWRENVVAHENL